MTPPPSDPAASSVRPFTVTDQQRRFFETFGFVRFDGLFADDVADITAAFDQVTAEAERAADDGSVVLGNDRDVYSSAFAELPHVETHDHVHFGERRVIIPYVLDKHERLSALTTDDRFTTVARALIGPDYEVVGSDGNVFDCETSWHVDIFNAPLEQLFVKFFLYLDPVDAEHGALRVIPGTNHWDSPFATSLRSSLGDWRTIEEAYGVPGDQIPSWSIDSRPGDLLVSFYRTMHATYGGGQGRRLIAVNLHGPLGA